jgi:hypothetical protein
MSVEALHRAAAGLREEWGGRNPMGTAWHRERDFYLAVADWLDNIAHNWNSQSVGCQHDAADVARAYLGTPDVYRPCAGCDSVGESCRAIRCPATRAITNA